MNSKKLLIIVISVFLSFCISAQQKVSNVKGGLLRAGIAKTEITPQVPVRLYGYASRKTYSEGVHDPLSARVVVFENNGKKVVLVSTDIGSYGREAFLEFQKNILQKFNLQESDLFLSAIHSHSSPILSLDPESGDPNNIKYTQELQTKLIALIEKAIDDLKPVTTGTGKGYSPVGSNRREMNPDGSISLGRNPYGPTDKEVLVMKIAGTDGTPSGAIFDYATHATSLGPGNMLISGDVLGISAQFVEKILGEEVVSPVFAGASGNIDPWYRVLPRFNYEQGWIPEPVLLGTLLGEEVVTVFRKIDNLTPGGEISTAFETMHLNRKKRGPEDPRYSKELENTTIPLNITAAKIGDKVAFIGFNVEMLTEIGMAIKEGSPFENTFIITHCNGSSGYLPPAELYKEGGYEITTSNFEIGSAEKVVKKALRMLYDL